MSVMLHYAEGASIELKAQEKVPVRNSEYQPFGCVVGAVLNCVLM